MGRCKFICVLLVLYVGVVNAAFGLFSNVDNEDDDEEITTTIKTVFNECIPTPKGGVEWILHTRQPDYGWKDQTHRAIIALAVSGYNGTHEESEQMRSQLEVSITKTLLQNKTSPLSANELALYIHALMALKRNPRNFYGMDLVKGLLSRVEALGEDVHPFLVLALCNTDAVETEHLYRIRKFLLYENLPSRRETELKAIAIKAFACAAAYKRNLGDFSSEIQTAVASLTKIQEPDGRVFNIYTTSLFVQALTACRTTETWLQAEALSYLHGHLNVNVNMVSTYYILLGLNAHKFPFIRSLHPGLLTRPAVYEKEVPTFFIQYTVRIGMSPDVYFTITIRITAGSNFFEIMKKCQKEDSKFEFLYFMDSNNNPMVYSISGVANNAEENFYWKICYQTDVDHDRHTSNIREIHGSPATLIPKKDSHVIMHYTDKDCHKS